MATADVQRRLLRTGQGVLGPAEGLAALRWVLRADGRGVGPQVSSTPRLTLILVVDYVVALAEPLLDPGNIMFLREPEQACILPLNCRLAATCAASPHES